MQQDNKTTEGLAVDSVSAGYLWECPNRKYALKKVNGVLWAFRYGEPWRNLVGDNLIMAMLNVIEELSLDNTEIAHSEQATND